MRTRVMGQRSVWRHGQARHHVRQPYTYTYTDTCTSSSIHLVIDDASAGSCTRRCGTGVWISKCSRPYSPIERVVRRPAHTATTATRTSEHVSAGAVGQRRGSWRGSPGAQPGHGRHLAWPERRAKRGR